MANIQDLPRLAGEFKTLAQEYLVQETIEPAKRLGRFAGFGLGAGLVWSIAVVFLGVAAMRGIVDRFPDSPYWEALGYVVAALAFAVVLLLIARFVPRKETTGREEQP